MFKLLLDKKKYDSKYPNLGKVFEKTRIQVVHAHFQLMISFYYNFESGITLYLCVVF